MAGVLTAGGAAEFFVGLNDVMNVIDQEVSFDWPCVTYEDRVVFWYPLGKDADVLCLPLPGKIVWRRKDHRGLVIWAALPPHRLVEHRAPGGRFCSDVNADEEGIRILNVFIVFEPGVVHV